MKTLLSLLFTLLLVISSCSIESEKINYGKESCHFCQMTIIDTKHAAETVTKKGKVYKFDSIECMISDLRNKMDVEIALLFVNDFAQNGVLINAESATFLISQNIKSPMGAFLSGFKSKEYAQKVLDENGGTLYNWKEIQDKVK